MFGLSKSEWTLLIGLASLGLTLGLWKLAELFAWLVTHVRVEW